VVFLIKYEFSKHPFDVSLITLEIFLPVSFGWGVVFVSRVNSASSTIHCRLFNLFSKTQFDNHFKIMFYIRCHFSIPIVGLEAFWMFFITLAWLQCSILVSCQLQTATQNGSTHVQDKKNEHYVEHHLQKAQSTTFKKIP
jgi:hypothetical protein